MEINILPKQALQYNQREHRTTEEEMEGPTSLEDQGTGNMPTPS